MSTNVQVFKLQHKSMKDYITFMVFPGSGADLEGNLNPEMDEVLIEPESRKDLPLGPKGEWEECDLCEADRHSARTVYTLLTHCCGYSLVK
jgi:hypothetical protein